MQRQDIDHPKPKKYLCSQFLLLLQAWTREGHKAIIMLDANDSILDRQFRKFVEQSGLYDVLGTHHSIDSPST